MTSKQSAIFHFRCPPQLRKAIEAEARRQVLTPSAYARRVIIQQLQGVSATKSEAAGSDASRNGAGPRSSTRRAYRISAGGCYEPPAR
jgi:hypothetical protein